MKQRQASVCFVEYYGRVLCVWNARYGSWGLPGGMVEMGEKPRDAAVRELFEETGLRAMVLRKFWSGGHAAKTADPRPGRASTVHFFEVKTVGVSGVTDIREVVRQEDPDHPLAWFKLEDLLRWSVFAPTYVRAFAARAAKGRA